MKKMVVLIVVAVVALTLAAAFDCAAKGYIVRLSDFMPKERIATGTEIQKSGTGISQAREEYLKRQAELKQRKEELDRKWKQLVWVEVYILIPLVVLGVIIIILSNIWVSSRVTRYLYTHSHPVRSWLKKLQGKAFLAV